MTVRDGTVSDDMARALIAKYREIFPGAGWPALETARELIDAALSRRSVPSEPVAREVPPNWQMDAETLAIRVEALAVAVEDRYGGLRADMSTGGSLSVKDVCALFCELLRFNPSPASKPEVTEATEATPFGHEYGEGLKLSDLMKALDAQPQKSEETP